MAEKEKDKNRKKKRTRTINRNRNKHGKYIFKDFFNVDHFLSLY